MIIHFPQIAQIFTDDYDYLKKYPFNYFGLRCFPGKTNLYANICENLCNLWEINKPKSNIRNKTVQKILEFSFKKSKSK